MNKPEDLTVHLLREIRDDFRSLDKRIDRLETKVDDGFAGVSKRLDSLQKALNGESLIGRYMAAEVEERLEAIEKRLSSLEKQR